MQNASSRIRVRKKDRVFLMGLREQWVPNDAFLPGLAGSILYFVRYVIINLKDIAKLFETLLLSVFYFYMYISGISDLHDR